MLHSDFMSRKYKFYDQSKLYFVSYATVGWVDVFVRQQYCEVVLQSLQYCIDNKGLEVYAWCIMSSHVHLIIGSKGDKLEDIMRDHKRHCSETLRKSINENIQESRKEWMMQLFEHAGKENGNNRGFQFWQQNNQPIGLITADMLYDRLNYLHMNSVAARFVSNPEDWNWSSAVDYYTNRKGKLEGLTLLEVDTRVK